MTNNRSWQEISGATPDEMQKTRLTVIAPRRYLPCRPIEVADTARAHRVEDLAIDPARVCQRGHPDDMPVLPSSKHDRGILVQHQPKWDNTAL